MITTATRDPPQPFGRPWRSDQLTVPERSNNDRTTGIDGSQRYLRQGCLARWSPPALVLDERRALVGGIDKVFEVDFDTDEVNEVFDYSTTFDPLDEDLNFESTRVLAPVDQLDDGRLVLYDAGVFSALNQTGGAHGGYSSGVYLGNPADGTLVPFFKAGTIDEGWLGPMTLILAGGDQYVVTWLDNTRSVEEIALPFVHTLSLLDLEVHDLPVDPNQLPTLWDDNGDTALTPIFPAPGYSAPISARSTMAFQTWGGRTIILEFPESQSSHRICASELVLVNT